MEILARLCRKLIFVIAILILLLACVMTLLRWILPYASQYKARIEHAASRYLDEPVSIAALDVYWRGIWPVIDLRGVVIGDHAIEIGHVRASINIFSTLIHHQLIFSQLKAQDFSLHVEVNPDRYIVNGLVFQRHSSTANNHQDLMSWLTNERVMSFENVDLVLKAQDDHHVLRQYKIHTHFMTLINQGDSHILSGDLLSELPWQAPLQFRLAIKGPLFESQKNSMQLFLRSSAVNLQNILGYSIFYGEHLKQGYLDGELWANWQQGKLSQLHSLLTLKGMQWDSEAGVLDIPLLSANLLFSPTETGWKLIANPVRFSDSPFNFVLEKNQNKTYLSLAGLDIQLVSQLAKSLAIIPQAVREQLSILKPSGTLTQVMVNIEDQAVKATVKDLAIQGTGKIPTLTQLSGFLNWQDQAGEVVLSSAGVTLTDPGVFHDSLKLDKVYLHSFIHLSPELQVRVPVLYAENEDIRITGFGTFSWKQQSPIVNALLRTEVMRANQLTQYLPQTLMHQRLTEWFAQAFQSGSFTTELVFSGDPRQFPFAHEAGTFSLRANAKDLEFHFSPHWPPIQHFDAQAEIQGESLRINATRGNLDGVPIEFLQAFFPTYLRAPVVLTVQGRLQGSVDQALTVLDHSTLKAAIADRLATFHPEGAMRLGLELKIPVDQHDPEVSVLGKLHWDHGRFRVYGKEPELTDLTGDLTFTEHVVNAETLRGNLLNKPVTLSFHLQDKHYNVSLQSLADPQAWAKHFSLFLPTAIQGEAEVNATVQGAFSEQPVPISVQLISSLQGVSIAFPKPVGKIATETMPVTAELSILEKQVQKFQVNEENHASLAGVWDAKTQWNATVFVDEVDWDVWQPYLFPTSSDHSTEKTWPAALHSILFKSKTVHGYNQILREVELTLTPMIKAWAFTVKSDAITGQFTLPESGVVQAQFKQLSLQPMSLAKSSDSTEQLLLRIPSIDLSIEQFQYGQYSLGKVAFTLRKEATGLQLKELKIESPLVSLDTKGEWADHHTHLSGTLGSQNFSDLLKLLGLDSGFLPGPGTLQFDLQWQSVPTNPQWETTTGHIDAKLGPGRLVHLGKSTDDKLGLGRVITALSVQSIYNTLTLNFNTVKEGYSFTSMTGDFQLQAGEVTTSGVTFIGTVADLWAAGRIELIKKLYDMKLNVTPHVTSSIPVVAAIAINPIVGVAAWVADKFVVTPALDKWVTYRFYLTGTWDEPKLVPVDKPKS